MIGRVLLGLATALLMTSGVARAEFVRGGPGSPLDRDDPTFAVTLTEGNDIPGFKLTRLPGPVLPGLVVLTERGDRDTISDAILFFNRPLFSGDPVAGYALFLSDRDGLPISLEEATEFLRDHLPKDLFDFIEDHTVILTEAEKINGVEDTLYTTGTRGHHNTYHLISDNDPVPEPASITLLGSGAICLLGYVRRRRRGVGV